MAARKGSIKVQTSDIFPIIKKWLYSEHDIFLRELISNATDAITKRATLARGLNQEIPEGRINVFVSPKNKTITIQDNGLGMTEEEVEKYIANLAFSGAQEFIEKMKSQGADQENGADIIGKFGLGFYSAFMVAKKVEVESFSMNEGARPVKWICEGETEYTFEDSNHGEVGTKITLHLNDESEEFLSEYKLIETLRRFCDFMPYQIEVLDTDREPTLPTKEDGTEDKDATPIPHTPTKINETLPLWRKSPSEITDDEYIEFYQKLFPMDGKPLFWIHLNVDHPFKLEGILYFPKFNPTKPFNDRNIRLYSKQVFVSDNVKNIIPEFLGLLKGAIDSTDIPLNVSRSSLQGDPNIRKISNYIIKKVAEALKKLSKNDREKYQSIWDDIGMFVKYGCISDNKFDELMRPYVLFKDSNGEYMTFEDYRNHIPEKHREKMKDIYLYFEKNKSDWSLRKQLLEEGIKCLETDEHIDPHFLQHVEIHKQGDHTIKFSSIDSEISNILTSENLTAEDSKIKDLFQNILIGSNSESSTEENANTPALKEIEVAKTSNITTAAYLKVDETMKRMQRMTQGMGQSLNAFPVKKTLVVNANNPLIKNALKLSQSDDKKQLVERICRHVEDLALISSEGLEESKREEFVSRSQQLIEELTNQTQ